MSSPFRPRHERVEWIIFLLARTKASGAAGSPTHPTPNGRSPLAKSPSLGPAAAISVLKKWSSSIRYALRTPGSGSRPWSRKASSPRQLKMYAPPNTKSASS